MSENLVNAAAELQKQMKMVKERNENIIKAHNSGLSTEGILEQFDINQETLDSVLKSAKRNGLLKSPIMEKKKPRRGRPPGKPQEETKSLLKETDLKKKPKPEKKPKQDAIDENLEKVSDDAKKVIESFAPEKKEEPVVEKSIDIKKYISEEPSKSISDIFPNAEESFKEVRKEMKRELFGKLVPADDEKFVVELKAIENYEKKALQDELKYMAAVMEEKDLEIAKLKEQVKRFDFLETLAIALMRNTIALVDQAEEQRLEGRQ